MKNEELDTIIERQRLISNGNATNIEIPRYSSYAVCNLRGGCGKTTLSFNLAYLADEILAVDACPQGNLSYFFDSHYFTRKQGTTYDLIMSHILPGLDGASNSGIFVGATNEFFKKKKCFYIPSSSYLYLLPSSVYSSIEMTSNLPSDKRSSRIRDIFGSLKTELEKEKETNQLKRCIIDTSPFLSGGTELSLYASEALIIPVRTDQQSISSLELLLDTLSNSESTFNKYRTQHGMSIPKVHMVVLTHCGWSTKAGAINKPNQQTMLYLKQVYNILERRVSMLSSDNTANHIVMLDDFLGTGRISSALSKPIDLLQAGESKSINYVKVCVNKSVEKCKNQLRYIGDQLW